MPQKAVLIGEDLGVVEEVLRERGYDVVHCRSADIPVEEAKRLLADADGVVARMRPAYNRDLLDAAPKLKVVARVGVGLENVDLDYCTARGIWVTVAPRGNMVAVAEQALAFIMDAAKKIVYMDKQTRLGNFAARYAGMTRLVEGKTLGILGLGRIGRTLAQKAHFGLGMVVAAYDPKVPAADYPDYVKAEATMEALFENADFLSVHMSSTPADRDLIDGRYFGRMKPGSVFINCARGLQVCERDLHDALKSGRIGWAGLDVLQTEPFDLSNPLFSLENVTFSPHLAGGTVETWRMICLQAAEGLDEVLRGDTPTAPANLPAGK